MKLALVGVGGAGGRIVSRVVTRAREEGRSFCHGDLLVFDTEPIGDLPHVSEDRQVMLGDMHPDVAGGGTDGDLDLAAEVGETDINEIRRAFDAIELYDVDAILAVASFAGGTGGGMGSVIVDELASTYEKPLYVAGVLPGEDEGAEAARNAARTLKTVVPRTDSVVLFDNDTWLDEEPGSEDDPYGPANDEFARRIVALFATGELDTGEVAESLLDPRDTMRTIEPGGVATIGRATLDPTPEGGGWLSWIPGLGGGDDDAQPSDALAIKNLVQEAVESPLTLPCDVSSAERALLVLTGPPSELSRRGFEQARYWLEDEADTVEVLAGDEPQEDRTTIRATVLLSNVTDVPRIEELQTRALDGVSLDARERTDGVLTDTHRE